MEGDKYVNGDGVWAELCIPMLGNSCERRHYPAHYSWKAFLLLDGERVALVEPAPTSALDAMEQDQAKAAEIGHNAMTKLGFKIEARNA